MRAKLYNQFICSSLMLPEHREGLNEHHAKERLQEKRYVPEVDEQEYEIWEYLIGGSLSEGRRLSVTYMGVSGKITATGVAIEVENAALRMKVENTDRIKSISLNNIISVTEA